MEGTFLVVQIGADWCVKFLMHLTNLIRLTETNQLDYNCSVTRRINRGFLNVFFLCDICTCKMFQLIFVSIR